MIGDIHRGAYGFRLKALQADLPHLVDVDSTAEEVELVWRYGTAADDQLLIDDERVFSSRRGAGSMEVRRTPARVDLMMPEELTPAAMVHPMMTTPLAILARWRGRATLHAGAVVIEGAAFALCGDREAGKSSLLAELTADGTPLVADDLLVIDDADVLAGPECLDLRPGAAERYRAAAMGTVGLRERFRLVRTSAPQRTLLGGIFALAWHDAEEPRVEPLNMAARLAVLHDSDYSVIFGTYRPDSHMDLLDTPIWRVHRRQSWDCIAGAADVVRQTARASLRGQPRHLQAG